MKGDEALPEFSRRYDLRSLPAGPVTLRADEAECAALASRFALVNIHGLEAAVTLEEAGGGKIDVRGRIRAELVQSCAISGEDLPVALDEELAFRFVPETAIEQTEIELEEAELDEIAYSGTAFDLGEAVAQSMALAIDPYAAGPEAERARREAGLSTPEASGPFAKLAALRKD